MRRTAAKVSAAEARTAISRESIRRGPTRMPPNDAGSAPEVESASDQRVCANARSSFSSARAIALRMSLGTTRNCLRAESSRTTDGCRMLSISLRPMRA